MYLSAKQKFVLILVPILFVGTWITLGIVNSIQNPGPYKPSAEDVYAEACIKKGGIPNTQTTSSEWSCEK